MQFRQIDLMGITISDVTYSSLHEFILNKVKSKTQASILNVNVNAMNIAAGDSEFREILLESPLVFADGMGIVLASMLQGTRLSGRITYADWMWEFARFSEEQGISWFLLGSERGIAQQASDRLTAVYPKLNVVGSHHGYFKRCDAPNDRVITEINRCKPDVLFVCLGMPEQEKWIAQYRQRLNATIFLDGGACLDYVSNKTRRCPRWMGNLGLEWLYRLIQDPGRLWRRYVLGNPVFFCRLFKYYLFRKRHGR
jgi:N-acetylglucosaminyldiphosphoundecaprenol N-acetyl-beta-D-mannosaminyltransferase